MKRTVDFHPRYAEIVPPTRSIGPSAAVVAIKLEPITLLGIGRVCVDIVLREDDRLHTLIFGETEPERILFPEPYRPHRTALERIVASLESWFDAHLGDELPMLYLFAGDPELDACAREESGPLVVPGLAGYQRVFMACDRYRAIAPLAAGRTVTDISGGSGFGTHLLLALDADVVLGGAAARGDVDRRLGYVERAAERRAEMVVALGIEATDVPATVARARALAGGEGIVALSARTAAGAEALAAAGLTSVPLVHVVADAAPAADEHLAVVVPPSVTLPAAAPPHADEHGRTSVAPRPLRVLFALRPSAQSTFGGDVVQVRETARALGRRGHDAVVTTDEFFDPAGFDVVHFSNLTIPEDTLRQMKHAERFPGAVVMMPIFTDHADETVWAIHVQPGLFSAPNDSAALDRYLELFAKRQLAVVVPMYGSEKSAGERLEMAPGYLEAQREICRRSDYFIANAHAEMHRVYRHLDPSVPYSVAPSAVDPSIYFPERAAAFRERYRLGDYVLVAGRFEERKNQLLLMAALRGSGHRLVMIGRNYAMPYGMLIRAYLGPNTVIFREMPEADLAGALAAARVVVLPSYDEVVSLTSLNAAACGASIVLTRQSYEHEYLRDDAEYCDPVDRSSIRAAVERAWAGHDERAERRAALSARVRREYTWDRSAELTEEAYYRVLASNARGRRRLEGP